MDPLGYFSFQPVPHNWCNKCCGMCYPGCGIVHIKEPLLLIEKNSLCGSSRFPLSIEHTSFYYETKSTSLRNPSAHSNHQVHHCFHLWNSITYSDQQNISNKLSPIQFLHGILHIYKIQQVQIIIPYPHTKHL